MNFADHFDDRFQRHFAAYLLRDTSLLSICRKYLSKDQFSNELIRLLVDILCQYFDQYHAAPGELIFLYLADLLKKQQLTEKLQALINGLCEDMLQECLQNRDYLLAKYDEVIQQLAFSQVLPEVVQLAQQGKVLDAQERLRAALQRTPRGSKTIGQFYTVDPTERIQRRAENEGEIIYTLFQEFDERRLYIRRGELGILQGQSTGVGKSVALCQLARNCAFQDLRALIITLELSENMYLDRLDSCCGGMPYEQLSEASILRQRIQRLIRKDDMILVKKFPGYYTTVDDLEQYVQMLRDQHAWYPDLILLDYADLLGVPQFARGAGLYEKGLEIFSHLRGWMEKDNIGMWTVSQSNREAEKESSAKLSTTGGSRAKNEIADLVLTINRKESEITRGYTRIGVVKVRSNGKSGYEFQIPTDLARMQFYDTNRQFTEGAA